MNKKILLCVLALCVLLCGGAWAEAETIPLTMADVIRLSEKGEALTAKLPEVDAIKVALTN